MGGPFFESPLYLGDKHGPVQPCGDQRGGGGALLKNAGEGGEVEAGPGLLESIA